MYVTMKPDNRLFAEYRKSLSFKLENLKTLILAVKNNSTLGTIEALRKELHRIAANAEVFGFKDAANLCQQLEWDLIAKGKNFYLVETSPSWYTELDKAMEQIEQAFVEKGLDDMANENASKTEEKKKIVVVDDDEDIIKLLDYEFRELGFEVQSFQNGDSALTFLSNVDNLKDVFLLILDRMLPDMDGLEILQKISKDNKPHVPVLILSALANESDIIAGLQSGAVDYVTKPFSVFLLMQKALNLLKSQAK